MPKSHNRVDLHSVIVVGVTLRMELLLKERGCVKKQIRNQKVMSFRAKGEESRVHKAGVTEILRCALDDKMREI